MKIYFELQYSRLTRGLKEFGVNPYLGILLIAGIFVLLSNLFFKKITHPPYLYPLLAILSVYPLGNVNRNEFLKNIFTQSRYLGIRLLENALVALPFCIFLLIKHQYIAAFSTVLGCALCSRYNKADRSGLVIPSPFSKRPYEFTVGFRKTFGLSIILCVITYIALSVDNFNLGILPLIGSLLLCMSFYSMPEPTFYVWVHAQPSHVFLNGKIKTAALYSLFLSLPLAIPLICFYPSKAYIVVIIVVTGLLYVIMGVVGKYENYPGQVDLLQGLKMGLGLVCPPALFVLIPHFYLRAVKKLNVYLR
jgi:hypothetical protein